jgi:hypothetical protein
MSTEQIVAALIQERDRLSRAIEALQGPIKRRGRPPRAVEMPGIETGEAPRRKMSAATRRKMKAAQKKRWAAKRAEK